MKKNLDPEQGEGVTVVIWTIGFSPQENQITYLNDISLETRHGQ